MQIFNRQPLEFVEAKVQYLTGALIGLLFWWLDAPSKLTPHAVAELFQSMSLRALDKDPRGETTVTSHSQHRAVAQGKHRART